MTCGLQPQHSFRSEVLPSAMSLLYISCCVAEFLDEEEPDAFTPFQVSEDMLEDDISSRYIYYN